MINRHASIEYKATLSLTEVQMRHLRCLLNGATNSCFTEQQRQFRDEVTKVLEDELNWLQEQRCNLK